MVRGALAQRGGRRVIGHAVCGLLAIFGAASCSILDIGSERVVGMIPFVRPLNVPLPDIPDTVTVSTSFPVLITTVGGGCTEAGYTEVVVGGREAVITPYDFQKRAEACTQALSHFEHPTTVRFEVEGAAVVVVRARDLDANPIEVEYPVWVRR